MFCTFSHVFFHLFRLNALWSFTTLVLVGQPNVAVAQWLRASNIFRQYCVSQHLSGAGSSPAGSVGRDLNLQKLNYQCLTTSVAVVLVGR